MTFYCNGEPLGRVEDVELEGVDITGLKVWKDETFTAEVDTSGWPKEHWQAIFGFIPIIRCNDCRFFSENWRCLSWHQFSMPEWFCSRAERRLKDERDG